MAKKLFGNLYRVVDSTKWSLAATGSNLAFGAWGDADSSTYKIFADGIEYNIADASIYEGLIKDLSTYVHTEVDGSIDRLDTSVSGIETWKAALALNVANNKVSITGVAGEVDFAGNDYVAVSTDASTIKISIDASVQHGKNESGDDVKLATKGYVDEAIEAAEGDLTDVSNRLADLSTYVRKHVDASIDRLDTSVNLLDASVLAAFQRNDVEDASINAIDGSLANLYEVVDSSYKAVDASLKAALKDVSISAIAADNVATITLGKTTEGDVTSTDSYTVKGDSYVKVGQTANDALTITLVVADTKQEIADASVADASVATAYAVKEYVQDQISTLESALEFKGSIDSSVDAVAKLTTAATSKGDTYVYSGTDKITYDSKPIEQGDLIIVTKDTAAGVASPIIVIERNLDGAVTADSELVENQIVIGDGRQEVKTTGYSIGADTSADFGTAKEMATESAVKQYVDAQDAAFDASMQSVIDASFAAVDASLKADEATVDDLSTRFRDASLKVSGDTYVNAAASKTGDDFSIDLSINYVNTSAGIANASSAGKLVDAKAVKDYVATAGGTLSAAAGVADASAVIKLTSGADTDLGTVTVESEDSSLLKVNYVAENKITLDLSIATMADASEGKTGLALAEDVHAEIVANEQVVAASFNKIQETVGLGSDLGHSDGWSTAFGSRTDEQAIIDLSTDLKALSDHLDASIQALDYNDSSKAGQFVVKVSETDGVINVSHAGLIVNGSTATSDADGNVVVTIDGEAIKVGQHAGDDATWAAKTIAEAIVDLSTAIDEAGSDIKSIEGDELTVVTGTKAVDGYVAVSASDPDENGKVTLDSSVLVADQVDLTGIDGATAATATGLATDAYVKDQIAYELAWNEL